MIFSGGLCEKVLDGSKTVTRRPVIHPNPGSGHVYACRYEVGKTYAVQPGRGKKAVGRILVTAVSRVLVSDIDRDDARREGFVDASEFRMKWVSLYGVEAYDWECCRIEFELVRPARGI